MKIEKKEPKLNIWNRWMTEGLNKIVFQLIP